TFIDGLRRSEPRAAALDRFDTACRQLTLFDARWWQTTSQSARQGEGLADTFAELADQFDTLDDVLRNRTDRVTLPEAMQPAVRALLRAGADPDSGVAAIEQAVAAGEIVRRIAAHDALRS